MWGWFCDILSGSVRHDLLVGKRNEPTKSFLIGRVKYCTQEGDVPVELLSSHNNLNFGKESG